MINGEGRTTLTHGAEGGPRCCHKHWLRTLMCTNRVGGYILYLALSWKYLQMLSSRQQDLASKQEKSVSLFKQDYSVGNRWGGKALMFSIFFFSYMSAINSYDLAAVIVKHASEST